MAATLSLVVGRAPSRCTAGCCGLLGMVEIGPIRLGMLEDVRDPAIASVFVVSRSDRRRRSPDEAVPEARAFLHALGPVVDGLLLADVRRVLVSAVHRALEDARVARSVPPDLSAASMVVDLLGRERAYAQTRSLSGPVPAEVFTLKELERRTGVPDSTLRRWCDSGRLPPVKFRGKWVASLEDVERLARERDR